MYADPKSPETTIKSLGFAPFLYTMSFWFASPIAVTEIVNPDVEEVVSPPTKSILYFSHASLIPSYSSSIASFVNLFEIATETVTCFAIPFMAYISEILTIIAL